MTAITSTTISVCSVAVTLFAEKALFIDSYGALIVADMHIGKADHFRKNGIAAPDNQDADTLFRLSQLISSIRPEQVIFLGDLFHSRSNASLEVLSKWLKTMTNTRRVLVRGNHDILGAEVFKSIGLDTLENLQLGPFLLSHDREKTDHYNLHGHLHPAVAMRGKGRSYLKLPCFLFSETHAVLPAFGNFTGLAVLKPRRNDRVFVTTRKEISEVTISKI